MCGGCGCCCCCFFCCRFMIISLSKVVVDGFCWFCSGSAMVGIASGLKSVL